MEYLLPSFHCQPLCVFGYKVSLFSAYGWIMCCHLFCPSLFLIGEFNAFTCGGNDKKGLLSCSLFSSLRALFHPHFLYYFLFQVIFYSEIFKILSHFLLCLLCTCFSLVTMGSTVNILGCSSLVWICTNFSSVTYKTLLLYSSFPLVVDITELHLYTLRIQKT